MPFLVGIDVGTTGTKATIVDLAGNVISSGYREYSCIFPRPNWVEQDAELVVQSTFDACRDAVDRSGVDRADILAVGFSTQRGTCGLVGESNEIIGGNFYVWQDNRAVSEMDYITSKLPANELYSVAGMPVTPTFALEKLIWIMRNDPEKYARAKKIVLVPDYVMYRFGADDLYCEVTNAGCSGMLDIRRLTWSEKILETYGIDPGKLPRLVKQGMAVGKVSKEVCKRTGLPPGTLLCTGSGDNQCGALGAGVVRPGDAAMSLGTSGVLIVGVDRPRFLDDMGLMVNPAAVPALYELEGIQLGAASSYRWARDTLAGFEKALGEETGVDAFALMENQVNRSPVGANGIIFMPFLVGSGYPYWNPWASGLFAGLSFKTTKSDIIRSVMEGITLESKDMYEKMKASGVGINTLTIIGGATKSPAWRQMIADMFNTKIRRLRVSDATIIGAAVLAGVGAGVFRDAVEGASRLVHFTDTVEPIPENVEKYDRVYSVYKDIYTVLDQAAIYRRLSALNS